MLLPPCSCLLLPPSLPLFPLVCAEQCFGARRSGDSPPGFPPSLWAKEVWNYDDEDKITHFIVDCCERGLLYSFSAATLREWGVEHQRGCIARCGDKWMAAAPYVTVPSEYVIDYYDFGKPGRPPGYYRGGKERPSDSLNVTARAILPWQGKRGGTLQAARDKLRDMRGKK
jgi:hypothetical protein